jgi:hypothetical protein
MNKSYATTKVDNSQSWIEEFFSSLVEGGERLRTVHGSQAMAGWCVPARYNHPTLAGARRRLIKPSPSPRRGVFRPQLPLLLMAKRIAVLAMVVLGIACAAVAFAADWTDPVEIRQELKRCVSYRARLDGQFLVVQATHETGWHTYAMDNKHRAQEKLAGKRSLGIDRPTEIGLTEGLELAGPWYQSPPKDFSKPGLRWFSWGFEGQALFVAKARRSGAGPARIAIRGQACTEATCKNIDVEISVPLVEAQTDAAASGIDFKTLVQVR